MSYIKQVLSEQTNELSMYDITLMYVEDVIKNSKSVEFFDGEEWKPNTVFSHFDCQKSALFSLGAEKLEVLTEGDNFVVICDHFERNEKYKILKFIR